MPLDYSPKAALKWHQRKVVRRSLFAAGAVLLAAFAAATLPSAWHRAQSAWMTWRNRALVRDCLTYTAPPDHVVLDLDDGSVKALVPAAPWVRWMAYHRPYPTAFLHGRRDAQGVTDAAEQLVAVQIETQLRDTYDGRTILDRPLLVFESYTVGRVGPSPYATFVYGSTTLVILPRPQDRVRVFAGQPDPADAAAFTIDVAYNGVRQSVRGRHADGVTTLTPTAGIIFAPRAWRHAVFWAPAGSTDAGVAAARTAAASPGHPSPTTWPPTPFGQPFNTPQTAPTK